MESVGAQRRRETQALRGDERRVREVQRRQLHEEAQQAVRVLFDDAPCVRAQKGPLWQCVR